MNFLLFFKIFYMQLNCKQNVKLHAWWSRRYLFQKKFSYYGQCFQLWSWLLFLLMFSKLSLCRQIDCTFLIFSPLSNTFNSVLLLAIDIYNCNIKQQFLKKDGFTLWSGITLHNRIRIPYGVWVHMSFYGRNIHRMKRQIYALNLSQKTTVHLIFSIQIAWKIFRFCRHDTQFQDKHVPLNHLSAI